MYYVIPLTQHSWKDKRNREYISACQGLRSGGSGREVDVAKGLHEDLCSDENVLYVDCVNVNIWVVILYKNFLTCYHWGKQVKGHRIFP